MPELSGPAHVAITVPDHVEVDYGTAVDIEDPDGNAIESFAAPDSTD